MDFYLKRLKDIEAAYGPDLTEDVVTIVKNGCEYVIWPRALDRESSVFDSCMTLQGTGEIGYVITMEPWIA